MHPVPSSSGRFCRVSVPPCASAAISPDAPSNRRVATRFEAGPGNAEEHCLTEPVSCHTVASWICESSASRVIEVWGRSLSVNLDQSPSPRNGGFAMMKAFATP